LISCCDKIYLAAHVPAAGRGEDDNPLSFGEGRGGVESTSRGIVKINYS